jgi:hypothetical protein
VSRTVAVVIGSRLWLGSSSQPAVSAGTSLGLLRKSPFAHSAPSSSTR